VELGTRVHELLERADFEADPELEAERLAASETKVPEGDRARIRTMLANVLADPVMERARGARRLEREYPFYLELGGSVVQGVIDLVFTDADGRGVVLDYKSNDLSAPDRVNVLTEHYRPQIELYALAARKAGLADPEEAVLYFLNQPVARTLPLDAARMERIEAEATRILGRIASEDWTTEPGEKCRNCGYRKRGFCEVGRQWRG
jgi:ATP-dependent helicase/nuclease subunit A